MTSTENNAAAQADADGDGDVDVVVARRQGPNDLLVNDGRGSFSLAAGRFPAETNWARALALADVVVRSLDQIDPRLVAMAGRGRQ